MHRETAIERAESAPTTSTLARLLQLGGSGAPFSVLVALDDEGLADALATELIAKGAAVCVLSEASRVHALVASVSKNRHGAGYFDLVVTERDLTRELVRYGREAGLGLAVVGVRDDIDEGAVAESPRSLTVSRANVVEVITGLVTSQERAVEQETLVH